MRKNQWLKVTAGALCASLLAAGGASAGEEDYLLDQLEDYQGISSMDQVTTVDEFSDVSPNDWAYSALQSLVERYDCIEGFPDGTFRGNTTLTRFEFAAALNECLNEVEGLLAALDGGVTQEDLQQLYALQQEFQAELAALGGRVDSLEARVDTLEAQQFSTTTKLNAEAIFQLDSAFAGDPIVGVENPDGFDVEEQTTVGYRVRLNFDTSFTGKDRLRTRLQADNLQFLEDTTGVAAASFNFFPLGTGGSVVIGELSYQFPILNDQATVVVAADGLLVDDLFNLGPTAAFAYDALNLTVAYNNLIYDVANADGAGAGVNILLGEKAQLDIGYFLQRGIGNDPDDGIFGSSYSTGAHLNVDFTDELSASIAYMYNFYDGTNPDYFYDASGFVGTGNAQQPFRDAAGDPESAVSHNLGFQFNYAISPKFGFGGYFGYAFLNAKNGTDESADLLTAQLNVYAPDLAKEGDTLLLAGAIAPTVISASGGAEDDESLPFVIDLEYRYPWNNYITTTVGGVAVINPEGDSDNDTLFVGTIRTVFSF